MMHARTCPYLKDTSEVAIKLIDLLATYTKTCTDAKKDLDVAVGELFAPFENKKFKK
jgi:hypothetical protein